MDHYSALKKLMPIDLGHISDADMAVEGVLLDSSAGRIGELPPEMFPATTVALLSRWEAEYGLINQSSTTIEERRRALMAKYTLVGDLSKNHFITIARALGYEIEIAEGGESHRVFRAGISRAGDPVYSACLMWSWTITTLNRPPASDIRDLFRDLNPPHMRINFNFRTV